MTEPFETQPTLSPAPTPTPDLPSAESPASDAAAGHTQPMTPVTPGGAGTPGALRGRWFVAGLATLLVVVLVGAILAVAGQGAASSAIAPRYLAPDTAVYLELRADLPGDQAQQLGTFLSAFPGFTDPSTLQTKLGESIDRLMQGSAGSLSYTTDIQPWFGGQVAIGVEGMPTGASGVPAAAQVLFVVSVRDAAGARSFLERQPQFSGHAPTTYAAATLWTIGTGTAAGGSITLALTSDALLASDSEALVKAAVDRGSGASPALATAADFTAAMRPLRGDRLGTIYAGPAFFTAVRQASSSIAPSSTCATGLMQLPTHLAGELHVQGNQLVVETRVSPAPSGLQASAGSSDLAQHVPGDAVAFLESRGFAAAWKQLANALTCVAGGSAGGDLKTVESVLGTSLPDLFSWVGDAAAEVKVSDGKPQGAILADVSDTAVATQRLATVSTLLRAAALAQPGTISVAEQSHDGATITTVTIETPGLQGLDLNAGSAPSQHLQLAYALKDKLFVLGVGAASVTSVLDQAASGSLAGQARFTSAVQAAGGGSTTGLAYLDIKGLRSVLESSLLATLPNTEQQQYASQVKPFLAPLDRLVVVGSLDGDQAVSRLILFTP